MPIPVRVFAGIRARVGSEWIEAQLEFPATLEQIRVELESQHPDLQALFRISRFAVDGAYRYDDEQISTANEIALIPPVSGG
ncbi:MAG: MoaD/ThiS family protein [Pirellulales bacterium]